MPEEQNLRTIRQSGEGHGCSVLGDTFAFQKSSDRRELPRRMFTPVDEGGHVRTYPLITASLDESFYPHGICAEGNFCFIFASIAYSDVLCQAFSCIGVHVMSCVGTHSLTMSAANACSTYRTQKIAESSRLETVTFDASSPTRHTSRRSSAQGRTPSYIDLGDCNQQCRQCGCLFWNEVVTSSSDPEIEQLAIKDELGFVIHLEFGYNKGRLTNLVGIVPALAPSQSALFHFPYFIPRTSTLSNEEFLAICFVLECCTALQDMAMADFESQ
nr:hypothetical protein [Tanacetum cinerariifolium]